MPLEYEAIRNSFNAIAHQYDDNAILQKEVLSRLLERLNDDKQIDVDLKPEHIVDLGCGTGMAISQLLKIFPDVKISALDFSQQMLKQIDNKAAEIIFSDVHDLPFEDSSIDIVFSNMLLHWSNEKEVFAECMRVLKPDGLLIMSCLGETSLFELKQAWSSIDNKPHVHNFPALHDLGDDLLKIGFEQVIVNTEVISLTYADIITLMKDIKASGGHNSDENRNKGLMPKAHLQQLTRAYEVFREENKLPASYEVVYLHAKKAKQKGKINLTIQT
ncbi:MAG: malonyl-ACP O-methyltransferase BioC [Alcanivoracaceae bacterium]|nr:malonyl-ACP O-methyltransferase BioC [Alcanivoracaceae bacterium]